jgi:hypothetical protein
MKITRVSASEKCDLRILVSASPGSYMRSVDAFSDDDRPDWPGRRESAEKANGSVAGAVQTKLAGSVEGRVFEGEDWG